MKPHDSTAKKLFDKYLVILVFSFVYACSISLFLEPNNLAPGGVTGISIIVNHYTGLSTGICYFLFNIPIMILGAYKFGLKFIFSTIVTIILNSAFVDMLAPLGPLTTEPILAALFGGALVAVSLGLILKVGSTSGGTDIIVRVLKLHFPHIETGRLFMFIDIVIVAISAIAFRNINVALYAAVAVIVSSIVMDKVLYGTDGAKLVFIISDKDVAIAEKLLVDINTGVTYVKGAGAYTEADKRIIMCVLKKQNLPKTQDMVRDIDPNAFFIITSANEVVGKGYKSPYQEKI